MEKTANEKLDVSDDAFRKRLENQFLIVNKSKSSGKQFWTILWPICT